MKETDMNSLRKSPIIKKADFVRWIVCLVVLGMFAACGAHSPSILKDHQRTIHVSVIKNETYQFALEERLTSRIIKAFQRDGRLKPALKSSADLYFEGRITDVKITPMAYSDYDRAIGYNMRIALSVTITDASSGDAIVKDRPFVAQGTFLLANEPASADTLDVSDILAEDILSYLIEGW